MKNKVVFTCDFERSLVMIAICEMHTFFTAFLFDNVFDAFKRNSEFLGFGRVDLAYENKYDCYNQDALFFYQTSCCVKIMGNHKFPQLDLSYKKQYICYLL